MKLSPLVHQFFGQYLPSIRGVSQQTIKSYRDAFRLFLPFAASFYGIKVGSLRMEHIKTELIVSFLENLQSNRKNGAKTRNHRLAALKSFAKMIRFIHPDQQEVATAILNIPQKREQKCLVGFLYQDEMLRVFRAVDLKRKEGFRDYTLLHLLYDSGARASEITTLELDYFNPIQKTLSILGKGNRFRLIKLEPKTCHLIQLYVRKYRQTPRPTFENRLFINQRGEAFTRHGIYRICSKYLRRALPEKRLRYINPVHSFRHSKAVDMLHNGYPITDIQHHLGHDNIQSTTIYLHLDLDRRRHIQKEFIEHMQSVLTDDSKIDSLLQWENERDLMAWLDSL